MSNLLAKASSLKPEIRLAQAVSEFKSSLSSEQKADWRMFELGKSPPKPDDVMLLTSVINEEISKTNSGHCFGPRFANFLQGVQLYAALGDVVLGASQNIVACSVWFTVRMSLLSAVRFSTYFEAVSSLLMDVGQSAPRHQDMALLYPKSKRLQSSLCEYFIVVVQLCHHILKYTQMSTVYQIMEGSSSSKLSVFKSDLKTWAECIEKEFGLMVSKRIEEGMGQSSHFRARFNQVSASAIHRRKLTSRLRLLDLCSTYEHQTTWRQTRKLGNATLHKNSVEYQTWKAGKAPRTLLFAGTLGSGKSVLLANIVEDLSLHSHGLNAVTAYFFCKYDVSESLKARTILGSLVRQLLESIPDLSVAAESMNMAVSCLDMSSLRDMLCKAFSSERIAYIVLDGLNECDPEEREILATEMKKLQTNLNLLLCVSYRIEPDERWSDLSTEFLDFQHVPIPDDNPDIDIFVENEIDRCCKKRKLATGDPDLVSEIKQSLSEKSQGMFLWVALQIKDLCSMRTDQAIRDALADLPRDLPETYLRILQKSGESDTSFQSRVLHLIMAAYRPLTTEELREALSVTPGNTDWNPSQMVNDIFSALTCCGCLVAVDEEMDTVQFIHHSVKQFLVKGPSGLNGRAFSIQNAQRTMADVIVTYLSYGLFETELSKTQLSPLLLQSRSLLHSISGSSIIARKLVMKSSKSTKEPSFDIARVVAEARTSRFLDASARFHFHRYSQEYWVSHILYVSGGNRRLHALSIKLARRVKTDVCVSAMALRKDLEWACNNRNRMLLGALIEAGRIDINAENAEGQTLLHCWAEDGHEAMFKLLLDTCNFNINERDIFGQGPLHLAAHMGHEAIVKMLLETDKVDINAGDMDGQTPLQLSAQNGHEAIVKMLLDTHKANIDARNRIGQTSIMLSAESGHEEIVKLLLDKGAATEVLLRGTDSGLEEDYDSTVLHAASSAGHERIVKMLLESDININARVKGHGTALYVASLEGHEHIAKLLLDKRAYTDIQCGSYGNALQAALSEGHEQIVNLLLERGASINKQGEAYGNALQAASARGHEHTVKLLLGMGANVNEQGENYGSALQAASANRHEQIVKLLLAKGADVNKQGEHYGNALQAASAVGHEQIVKLLLRKGADVNKQGGYYGNALRAASIGGHKQIVELLKEAGAYDTYLQSSFIHPGLYPLEL